MLLKFNNVQRFAAGECQKRKKAMIKALLPLVVMTTMLSGCKKEMASGCLQARVIRVTCASIVMQVLSDNSIGEDGWVDTFNDNRRYNNVFVASNPCEIPSAYKTAGNIVYLTIDKPRRNDCVTCALYDAPPKVSYAVKTIGSGPCRSDGTKLGN